MDSEFDAFTGGILHDLGKLLNVICYKDIYPLILYEIEQSQWKGGLLESETAVVWDFQHPGTGSALLVEWDIFHDCVVPVHHHHQIHADSAPETVLIALANCLVKGLYPFPFRIDIPPQFREAHLEPVADPELLDNPLPGMFQNLVELFELEKDRLLLTPQEVESGDYKAEKVDELILLARTSFENSQYYRDALIGQNPEFSHIVAYLKVPVEELLGLSFLLEKPLRAMVNGLCLNSREK